MGPTGLQPMQKGFLNNYHPQGMARGNRLRSSVFLWNRPVRLSQLLPEEEGFQSNTSKGWVHGLSSSLGRQEPSLCLTTAYQHLPERGLNNCLEPRLLRLIPRTDGRALAASRVYTVVPQDCIILKVLKAAAWGSASNQLKCRSWLRPPFWNTDRSWYILSCWEVFQIGCLDNHRVLRDDQELGWG